MALSVAHGLMIAAIITLGLISAVTIFVGAIIAAMVLLVRPWDGNTTRDHRWTVTALYPLFWLVNWILRAADYITSLKPGTLRAGELARAFVQSQVLFALCNLGVPDLLCSGPRTAADLAANIGPAVPVDWLERLLATAAAYGMLNRKRGKAGTAARQQQQQVSGGKRVCDDAEDDVNGTARFTDGKDISLSLRRDQQPKQQQQQQQQQQPPLLEMPAAPAWVYSLNGVSAALTKESPVSVANLVKMNEDHAAAYPFLSEGIRTGKIPFELWSGGQIFWQHLQANPRHEATFDAAMHEVNQFGGTAVAVNYPWSKFDCVVDVAGGVGGFLADILGRHPQLRGVLFDQPAQIQRAQALWQTTHSSLAPRVQLVPGDMFEASSIPGLPSSGIVAYVLRNILHDWSDKDCVAILQGIRSRISAADVGRALLLVVEITTIEEVLPCLQPYRCNTDMNMLVAYGDGKERSRAEFKALFAAAGFKLQGIRPSCGIMLTLEAAPV